MDGVSSHGRASPIKEYGSSDDVKSQEIKTLITENDCMSLSFNHLDEHENNSSHRIIDEDTTHKHSNGAVEFQERKGILKNSLLNMLKLRYKEICVLFLILISLFAAFNNG